MITIEYTRELFAIIDQVKDALVPLMLELPMLVDSAAAERRLDVDEGKKVRRLVRDIRFGLSRALTETELELLAGRFAGRSTLHQKNQFARQATAALGVDIFIPDTGISTVVDGFIAENVGLIESIPEKLLTDVESTINRGFRQGVNTRDLTSAISERFNVARNRARLIARDQIGSVIAQVNKTRQTAIGVTQYRWRTVGDERVRDEHDDREGEIFDWKNPPDDGHPGEPIQCRCSPEPVFDSILAEAA